MLKKSYKFIFLITLLIIINGCELNPGMKGSRDPDLGSDCNIKEFVNFLMDNPDASEEEIINAANRYMCIELITGTTYQRDPPLILEYIYVETGDLDGDGGHNVLDIVTLANCILAGNC